MPKINVYLPDELAAAVREAQLPVSSICQVALEAAVRDVAATRATDEAPEHPGRGSRLFTRLSPRARAAVERAYASAHESSAARVGSGHVLLGILDEPDNLALAVLDSLDVEVGDLRAELVAAMEPVPTSSKVGRRVRFSPSSKRALEAATKEALGFGHNYIGCEHLLLGLLAVEESTASTVMRRMGLELRTTRRAVTSAVAGFATARRALGATTVVPAASPDPGAPADSDPPAATTAPEPSTSTGDELLRQIVARLDDIERRLAG